jgi:copper resistance protein B
MTSQVHAGGERDPLLTYFLIDTLEISDQTGNPTSWGVRSWIGQD